MQVSDKSQYNTEQLSLMEIDRNPNKNNGNLNFTL